MFTFGREHEIKCAERKHGGADRAHLILEIIHAIHDFQDGNGTIEKIEETIRKGFTEGSRFVWEESGNWLFKLEADNPSSEVLWREFARHSSAEVRFRVACFIIKFREPLRSEIYTALKTDKSKRVRNHVEDKWDYIQHPEKYA